MALKKLGNSDLEITPIGMGTWAIGGDWAFGWGPQDNADSITALRRSVESGINWIDTAPIYGFGHAERIVARALEVFSESERPLVFTKCGIVWDDAKNVGHNLKVESVCAEVNASLHRLQTEVLDLCQIHWPAFPPGASDDEIEEGWSTLVELKAQGKIRQIGVSNFDVAQMERLRSIAPITSLQPPYSMLMRQIEDDVLPYCEQNGIGVIGYAPLHNGMLSGKMTRERIETMPQTDWRINVSPAFKEPHLTRNLDLVEVLREIGESHGRSVAEIAIAWTLRLSAITGVIVGGRNAGQVDGVARALAFRLSEGEITEIDSCLPASIDMMQLT